MSVVNFWFKPATITALQAEMKRAVDKHGVENTPLVEQDSDTLAILAEEIGEVAECGADPEHIRQLVVRLGRVARFLTYDNGDREKLAAELLQVSAMSLAWYQRVTDE